MQCMGDLRTGVKLKKVNLSSKTPIEFELTPYEILMDDIRTRNYKLRKVEAPREGGRAFEKVRRLFRDILPSLQGQQSIRSWTSFCLGYAGW